MRESSLFNRTYVYVKGKKPESKDLPTFRLVRRVSSPRVHSMLERHNACRAGTLLA
jgi:hypothetical protein